MKHNKINLFRAKYSMLLFDCLGVLFGENWKDMRKESRAIYRLLEAMYKVKESLPTPQSEDNN